MGAGQQNTNINSVHGSIQSEPVHAHVAAVGGAAGMDVEDTAYRWSYPLMHGRTPPEGEAAH